MKKQRFTPGTLFLIIGLAAGFDGICQKQIIVTSSRINNYCNGTCTLIDVPELNENPTAVIFITSKEVNGLNLDPHIICAYYTGKQWSIMNVDNATVPPGSQFNVQYYATPDNAHFVHVVSKENLVKNNSYIDHDGLNGNPNAQIQYFQNAAPNIRGGSVNKAEIKIQYDEGAGKWYMANGNGTVLDYATGYNISITSDIASKASPITIAAANTATVLAQATLPSPQRIVMSVVGKSQGQFSGDNGTSKIELTDFEMEASSPMDAMTGASTGKLQHFPVRIEKLSDASSLQFLKSLSTNEQLATVTIEVYKLDISSGAGTLDYKVTLTNASIRDFKQYFDRDPKARWVAESVKFSFQSIAVSSGTTTVSTTW